MKRIIIAILIITPILASAQASGGQIKRVNKTSSPVRSQTKKHNKESIGFSKERTESKIHQIKLLPIDQLPKYSIVVSSYGCRENAQKKCQELNDANYNSYYFFDSQTGTGDMYRVAIHGVKDKKEAFEYRNIVRQTFPDAWILGVENGDFSRIVE